jgi:hypothetical protein
MLTFGIGPSVVAPTASNDVLGSGKWQGGVAAAHSQEQED